MSVLRLLRDGNRVAKMFDSLLCSWNVRLVLTLTVHVKLLMSEAVYLFLS